MKNREKVESLEFKALSSDPRGQIFGLEVDSKVNINLLTINKGFARGGHSHSYDELFCVVTGSVEYHTGTIANEKVTLHGPGSVIRTRPGEPHYMVAKDFAVAAEVRPSGVAYSADTYEPFRKIVLLLMNRKEKK